MEGKKPSKIPIIIVIGVVFLLIVTGLTLLFRRFSPMANINFGSGQSVAELRYPLDIPSLFDRRQTDSNLSKGRQNVLRLLLREFESPGQGTKYSEGVAEPWCADFVSWILHEAKIPLKNPHSGSWRIPGVYTLREYFQSVGRYHLLASGYQPLPGDVVFYDEGSFGTHVNFFVDIDGDTIFTLGGNENFKVFLQQFDYRDEKYGAIGFGQIE